MEMVNRWISLTRAAATVLAMLSFPALPVTGQTSKAASKPALRRTPDGHPDLQGTYDLGTMTPMERQPGDPPFLTKAQAEALEKAEIARRAKDKGLTTGGAKSFFETLEQLGGG